MIEKYICLICGKDYEGMIFALELVQNCPARKEKVIKECDSRVVGVCCTCFQLYNSQGGYYPCQKMTVCPAVSFSPTIPKESALNNCPFKKYHQSAPP